MLTVKVLVLLTHHVTPYSIGGDSDPKCATGTTQFNHINTKKLSKTSQISSNESNCSPSMQPFSLDRVEDHIYTQNYTQWDIALAHV